jgi:SWI/SNF-related matrix-associated actin-dependent regulator of chromatin subfamily A-like protein 1
MELTFENGIFYITCEFKQRKEVSKMGFKWCPITKRWATANWYVASKAPGETPQLIRSKLEKIASSAATKPHGVVQDSKLMPFQQAGVEEIRTRQNILLADEQGLGKTAQVISYLNSAQLPPKNRILIICPASLKLNWVREFLKFGTAGNYYIKVLSNGKDKIQGKSIVTGTPHNVVVVNYDLLKSKFILDQLKDWKPSIIVCDEAHYVKNAKTSRAKNTAGLIKGAAKTIFITGTPVLNRPIELHNLLKMISVETMAPFEDYRRYAYRFCAAHEGRWGFDVSGSSNEAELNARLRATCMIRRMKADVLPQLPDKTIQLLPFEQDKHTKKIVEREYRFTFDDLTKHPERGAIGDIAKLRHELALAKLPTSISTISDLLDSVNKVVVFAHHRDVMDGLMEGLAQFNPVNLSGGMAADKKQKAVDDFQTKPEVRAFIGQIQAAGVGITLTASSNVEFVETSWVPGEIDQAIDRCHRIGQKSNVTARFHVVEDSLDETMLKSIFDKKKNINKILE